MTTFLEFAEQIETGQHVDIPTLTTAIYGSSMHTVEHQEIYQDVRRAVYGSMDSAIELLPSGWQMEIRINPADVECEIFKVSTIDFSKLCERSSEAKDGGRAVLAAIIKAMDVDHKRNEADND